MSTTNGLLDVNYIMTGPDDKIKEYQQKCYIKIELNEETPQSEEEKGDTSRKEKKTELVVDWSKTPLNDYFISNRANLDTEQLI